jgi:hypothetical protein
MYADKPDLQLVIADLQRQWGATVVRPLADLPASTRLPAISTGFPVLDDILACGGIPQQRLTVFTGSPTSGTTTLAYHLMAQVQRQQQVAIYLDLHHCFDPLSARSCGVEVEGLLLYRPNDVTEALSLLRDLTAEDTPLLAVLDGLLLRHLLPNLRTMRSALSHSQTTLLLLLPPELTVSINPDVCLHVERRAWLYHWRDVRGYSSAITVMQDMGHPAGAQAEIEIVP